MVSEDRQGYRYGIIIAIVTVILVVAICVFARWWMHRPADTSHVQYSYSSSTRFSKAQLDAAGRTITQSFSTLTGCTLHKVTYDEAKTDEMLDLEDKAKSASPDYWSSVYDAYQQYGRDRIFMATVDFDCDGSDPSLPDGPQSMTWYLRLNDDGRTWTEVDHGNG